MKKNRTSIILKLISNKKKLKTMKQILLQETTTLGIRYYPLTVFRSERKFIKVSTKWGSITVKQGIYEGEVFQNSPEFEDCKKVAEKQDRKSTRLNSSHVT